MEYTQLESLVPQGEHFDSSAINEGVYLTLGHLNNIEASLNGQATVVAEMQQQIDAAKVEATQAQNALATAQEQITADAARISQLEQDLATAKSLTPAGGFKDTNREKDEHGGGESPDAKYLTSVDEEMANLRAMREGK